MGVQGALGATAALFNPPKLQLKFGHLRTKHHDPV
jgi:hypothetical protein